mmetsp:Transcript_8687/g.39210  ORF Transcript_8687/g.39210 Transcript_8687/m.39210 type:complete len:302 (+) Transcript_8687:5115-6020(+)
MTRRRRGRRWRGSGRCCEACANAAKGTKKTKARMTRMTWTMRLRGLRRRRRWTPSSRRTHRMTTMKKKARVMRMTRTRMTRTRTTRMMIPSPTSPHGVATPPARLFMHPTRKKMATRTMRITRMTRMTRPPIHPPPGRRLDNHRLDDGCSPSPRRWMTPTTPRMTRRCDPTIRFQTRSRVASERCEASDATPSHFRDPTVLRCSDDSHVAFRGTRLVILGKSANQSQRFEHHSHHARHRFFRHRRARRGRPRRRPASRPRPRRGHLPLFHQDGDGTWILKTRPEFDATRRRIRRVRLRRQG